MLAALMLAGLFEWPGGPAGAAAELGAREDGTRLRAVLELAAAEDGPARALLVPALRDHDPSVRLTAARLLARRSAPEAVEAATAWLAGPIGRDRLLGLQVLREVDTLSPAARRAVERATRDGELMVRVQALDVLAGHDPAASFGAVLATLGDEHRDVRTRAARVLATTRDARAALPLVARLEDGDRQVRVEAIAALGALGAAGERRVVPALLRQLQPGDATPDLRLPAIDALGLAGDPTSVTALAGLARRRPRDELARHALVALGRLATPEALDVLRVLAREPEGSADVRGPLALAGARALPVLARELADGTPTSASLAAEVLGALGDRRATPLLVASVDGRGPGGAAAIAALARLADDAAVPALLRAAMSTSSGGGLRAPALDALAELGDDRAAEALPRALADAAADVRAAAARAAGACGVPALAPAVASRLADADADVRKAAARALARLAAPSPAIARAIVTALTTPRQANGLVEDAEALAALGESLERAAGAGDAGGVEQGYLASVGPARVPLARGLVAVHADAPLTSPRVIDALVAELLADDARAVAAADALGVARPSAHQQEELLVAFARAEESVAGRLAPALAGFPAGVRELIATLREPAATPSRRAAAAWALAGSPEAAVALREAVSAREPPVAANARAALAIGPRARPRAAAAWATVRLVTADGAPWPRRWLTLTAPGGPPVWTMTDLDGRARLAAAAEAAAATVSVPPE